MDSLTNDIICCADCEYFMTKKCFEEGKGRIMFNDLPNGQYRCGVCDDRVSDPEGIYPDTEEEDEKETAESPKGVFPKTSKNEKK